VICRQVEMPEYSPSASPTLSLKKSLKRVAHLFVLKHFMRFTNGSEQ